MGMRSDVIVLRRLQTEDKHAFFARIAVEHRRLGSRRNGRGRRSPFDVLRGRELVLTLSDGAARQQRQSNHAHCCDVEDVTSIHCVAPKLIVYSCMKALGSSSTDRLMT